MNYAANFCTFPYQKLSPPYCGHPSVCQLSIFVYNLLVFFLSRKRGRPPKVKPLDKGEEVKSEVSTPTLSMTAMVHGVATLPGALPVNQVRNSK